jgi:hypothetical protein
VKKCPAIFSHLKAFFCRQTARRTTALAQPVCNFFEVSHKRIETRVMETRLVQKSNLYRMIEDSTNSGSTASAVTCVNETGVTCGRGVVKRAETEEFGVYGVVARAGGRRRPSYPPFLLNGSGRGDRKLSPIFTLWSSTLCGLFATFTRVIFFIIIAHSTSHLRARRGRPGQTKHLSYWLRGRLRRWKKEKKNNSRNKN